MSFVDKLLKKSKPQIRRYVPGKTDTKPIGIYIHVPFCVHKCPYCDFYSLAMEGRDTDALYDDYVSAIITGLDETGRISTELKVDTVYFGGGTPTLIGAKRLVAILKQIKKNFIVSDDAEISFETNPAVATPEELSELRAAGFNRISIGVQSFSDTELKALGRIHTAMQAAQAIKDAKAAGFDNVNIDLMYGISGQTMNSWGKTLTVALKAGVSHISLYSLLIEEGTPYGIVTPPNIPDDDLVADMYLNAIKFVEANGYEQYEISNVCMPGKRCRHNMKYWRCGEYLGFGPAAHSYYKDARYSYIRDLEAYIRAMKEGDMSVLEDSTEIIRPRERVGEYLMLGLRLSDGINEEYFKRNYVRDLAPIVKVLEPYIGEGYVRYENGSYSLTPKGFLVSNRIINEVLEAAASPGGSPFALVK